VPGGGVKKIQRARQICNSPAIKVDPLHREFLLLGIEPNGGDFDGDVAALLL
jgi:hypothetical protein